MTSSISHTPSINVILTKTPSNFELWKRSILLDIIGFKLAARPILTGIAHERTPPTADRKILNDDGSPTTEPYYRRAENGALTEPALAEFRQDLRDFDKASQDLYNQSCELFQFILSTLSPATKTSIRNDPAWTAAFTETDPLKLFNIIIKVYSCPNAAETQQRTVAFLTIQQTGDFDDYIENFQTGYQRLLTDLADEDGNIKSDSIGALVLLGGLDRSQFQYKINSLLDAAHNGKLTNIDDLTQKLSVYAKAHPKPEPEQSAFFSGKGATIPTKLRSAQAPSATPSSITTCAECKQPFPLAFHKRTGDKFIHCYTCASKKFGIKAASTDLTSAHVAQGLLAAADSHSHRIAMEADYQSQQIARFQLQRQQLPAAAAYSELDDDIFADHAFLAAPMFRQPLPSAASALDADCRSESSSPDEHSEYAYSEDSDDEPYAFSANELAYLQSPECLDGSDYDQSCNYGDFVFPPNA